MKNSSKNPTVKYRKDYRPSQYLIKHTDLKFQLFDSHTLVNSELKIEKNPLDKSDVLEPLVLDGLELELQQVSVDGNELSKDEYEATDNHLTINNVSEKFTLNLQVKIYPQKNKSLEGLYTSGGKFCTQCEAEGFRKITYYLDRPEIMSEFKVRIEGDKAAYPLLLSNGNPLTRGDMSDGRHFVEWHDPFPKPSYLFALVAGDLDCLTDSFTTMSGREVKLELYVDKGKLDQCRFAMDSLIESMRWDEEKFGREYDLDLYMIVAVSDFNMGAMENKGLNVFNTKYVLANKKTATDADFEGVERVIAHEYFHNWTGNRVTCRDWFQLSLKEGLTVFRDQKFSEDMQSKAVQRIDQVKIIRSSQFAEDSGPMAHSIRPDSYIEMNNFYTVTVYNKGAEVIRMMHTLLGEQGFRAGMDLYFERHDGQAVTCEDFICAMEDANQKDWALFRNWYRQAGTPEVKVQLESLGNGKFELQFAQSCPATPGQETKKPFMIPVKIGFINAQGDVAKFRLSDSDDVCGETLFVMTEENQTLTIHSDNEVLIPSLLRDFSAPVKLKFEYDQSQLATLFASDPNSFNRWDAGQSLMTKILLNNEDEISEPDLEILKNSFAQLLGDEQLDNSLKALAVILPEISSLIGRSEKINVDRLFNKHRQLKKHIGQSLEHTWFSIYNTTSGDQPSDRKLRNVALDYMMVANDEQHFELAATQQTRADNMTDELSALQTIANSTEGYKSDYINQFYQKWKDEELVMDKWFSAQVINDDESIIEHVNALLNHEKFSIENPNKVRAVITAFISGNLPQFHNATGAGYELLADTIIRLNAINPQIAAGLSKQFNQWKKLDGKRQALIKEQLERIKAVDNLSNDVYEVVEKSLNM
ncbi:aminopeptidase N [Aliikangiella coralliicola]|uniref:Aminopeptidase N n=1 Tax=Aliikangiella coralliicola TaxID=2592383 RepID=A0A545TWC8_9GAMM|nr:aminopeptidase N [Aliikangiella coralliicola]TQV81519.1 aminopeptidase N [Aliikangiella coralliicola]